MRCRPTTGPGGGRTSGTTAGGGRLLKALGLPAWLEPLEVGKLVDKPHQDGEGEGSH